MEWSGLATFMASEALGHDEEGLVDGDDIMGSLIVFAVAAAMLLGVWSTLRLTDPKPTGTLPMENAAGPGKLSALIRSVVAAVFAFFICALGTVFVAAVVDHSSEEGLDFRVLFGVPLVAGYTAGLYTGIRVYRRLRAKKESHGSPRS